jgi:hypothetical protein
LHQGNLTPYSECRLNYSRSTIGDRIEQPLWTEEEFDETIREMVAESAPRVFAVVQVCGKREDGWIAAWGIAIDDGEGRTVYEIVSVEGGKRIRARSLERLGLYFGRNRLMSVRVEWVQAA